MFTAAQDCRTIGDLLEGHALNVLDPGEASAVRAHLAACPGCREEHHCLAAVAAHLSSLRRALADDPGRRPTSLPGPARAPRAASLTLSQWVSRLAYVR